MEKIMGLDSALQTYISESRELLEEMEDALLKIENENDKQESLNAIFRAAHTIKGSAGLFGLDEIVNFVHGVESLLDMMRTGVIDINTEIAALILDCRDYISNLIEHYALGDGEIPDSMRLKGDGLSSQIRDLDAVIRTNSTSNQLQPNLNEDRLIERIEGAQVASDNWHISLRFGKNALRDGMDPISFLRYLNTLGEIVSINTLDDALPLAEQMDPESCYLGFEINFKSNADKQSIENVFEFIRSDSLVRILPPRSQLAEYILHIQDLPEEDMRLGEILVRSGSLTQAELNEALQIQKAIKMRDASQPLGSIVVDSGSGKAVAR
jgi:two-component system chemotaxis sensor kinase CheA